MTATPMLAITTPHIELYVHTPDSRGNILVTQRPKDGVLTRGDAARLRDYLAAVLRVPGEAKTAADAPAMAHEAICCVENMGRIERHAATYQTNEEASMMVALEDISALPPARLPADVAAELAAYRTLAARAAGYSPIVGAVMCDIEIVTRLAALHRPAPHKP